MGNTGRRVGQSSAASVVTLPRPQRLMRLLLLVALGLCWSWGAASSPAAHADGGAPNLAYVVGGGSHGDDLVVVDIAQRKVAWSLSLGSQPRGVVLSADGRFAYVTEADANRVAIVDARAQQVIGSVAVGAGPAAIAADPMGGLYSLFVANTKSNTLNQVDAGTRQIRATVTVGQQPVALAVATPMSGIQDSGDPSTREVYVANRASQTLSVITASDSNKSAGASGSGDLKLTATIPLPEPPCALTVPGTGGIAYVATCPGKVLAIGLASHRVLGVLLPDLGGAPGMTDYDAITGQIYVPVPTKNQVVILRPAGLGADGRLVAPAEPLRTLTFAGGPAAVAITFDGALGFVAERDGGNVDEIDVTTRNRLGGVFVGGAPLAIITGPYPPALNREASGTVTAWVYGVFALGLAVLLALMIRGYVRDRKRDSAEPEGKAE